MKKIEHKPTDNDMKEALRTEYEKGRADAIAEMQVAWSEEDEEMHRKCICAMRASACGFPEEEKFVEQVNNWLNTLEVKKVQEEPVSEDNNLRKASEEYLKVLSKTPYNNTPITNAQIIVRELITFLDNPSKYNPNHIEELIGEELEEASKEWLAPQLDKSYAAYGETKQMELTHFDGYAMLDAIEFGAKWGKNQAMAEIQAQSMALAHGCPEESENEDLEEAAEDYGIRQGAELKPFAIKYFKAGAKWKEKQMMSKAIVREVKVDAGGYPYIDTTELYDYDKDMPLAKEQDKVKVIVIKEE